jgi:hypothetical protein
MALQTSGAISLANVQTEFEGENPISISEYYANGTYVPAGTSGTNGAVPTSGQISFSQFYGTINALVSLDISYSAFHIVFSGTATAGIRLTNAGAVDTRQGAAYFNQGDWVTPTSAAGNAFEARVSNISGGSLTSGTVNTWLGLGTTREWFVSRSTAGSTIIDFTLEIRQASTGTVLASSFVTLEASR